MKELGRRYIEFKRKLTQHHFTSRKESGDEQQIPTQLLFSKEGGSRCEPRPGSAAFTLLTVNHDLQMVAK